MTRAIKPLLRPIVATVEARVGSTRLPRKVLRPLNGIPLIQRVLQRVVASAEIDRVVLAVPDSRDSAPIVAIAESMGIESFAGSEDDVLGRVAAAVRYSGAKTVVPLTGDNPFIDPELIDDVLRFFAKGHYDYVTTTHMDYADDWNVRRTFPRGVSVQVVRARALLDADTKIGDSAVREHSTFAVYGLAGQGFRLGAFEAQNAYADWHAPEFRMTVDTAEDFQLAEAILSKIERNDRPFSTCEAIRFLRNHPEISILNNDVEQVKPLPIS